MCPILGMESLLGALSLIAMRWTQFSEWLVQWYVSKFPWQDKSRFSDGNQESIS